MVESLSAFYTFVPAVLFVASALDIFFATGLFLYGAAMMGSIAMMHANGLISVEMIILSSYTGTVTGNILNFAAGRLFGESSLIKKKLQHPKIKKAHDFLETRGLFFFILGCRFFAVTRPLYALILGSLKIPFARFIIYEAIIALAWVVFWLIIIIQGEKLYFHFFQ